MKSYIEQLKEMLAQESKALDEIDMKSVDIDKQILAVHDLQNLKIQFNGLKKLKNQYLKNNQNYTTELIKLEKMIMNTLEKIQNANNNSEIDHYMKKVNILSQRLKSEINSSIQKMNEGKKGTIVSKVAIVGKKIFTPVRKLSRAYSRKLKIRTETDDLMTASLEELSLKYPVEINKQTRLKFSYYNDYNSYMVNGMNIVNMFSLILFGCMVLAAVINIIILIGNVAR